AIENCSFAHHFHVRSALPCNSNFSFSFLTHPMGTLCTGVIVHPDKSIFRHLSISSHGCLTQSILDQSGNVRGIPGSHIFRLWEHSCFGTCVALSRISHTKRKIS